MVDLAERRDYFDYAAFGVETRERAGRGWIIVAYILLTLWGLILFSPMAWMVLCALSPDENLQQTPPLINPRDFSFDNFDTLYSRSGKLFYRWIWNSFYIAVIVTAGGVFLSALAGYCFAKMRFPGRNVIFWLMIATMIVPYEAIVIPLFVVVNNMLHLSDTHLAIILPQLAAPFGIFLCRQYMLSLPSDLEDTARMDGCSEFGVFMRVMLPVSKPVLALLAIFTFLNSWKSFFWPLVVLRTESKFVLEVGLSYIQDTSVINNGVVMAGATAGAIPMVIFFLLFQRQLLSGMAVSSLRN